MLLSACATAPESPPQATGTTLARAAEALLGTPYRYGGADRSGFDCSGLVYFVHAGLGLEVPRTAAAQQRSARPVPRGALAAGDLVFFRTRRAGPVDHVGVYAGDGRFVHAPGSGRTVSYGLLEDPWYAVRFVGAGRFWTPRAAATAIRTAP